MFFTRASVWAYFGLFAVAAEAGPFSSVLCPLALEGNCRGGLGPATVEICAAGKWQQMDSSTFRCVAGTMVPLAAGHAVVHTVSSTASAALPSAVQNESLARNTGAFDPQPLTDTTGNAYCSGLSLARREDQWGRASYHHGGKMASTYDATADSAFRCDRAPPPDGHYVAFWTQYDEDAVSQPKPMNCNRTLSLTNPRLGKTATAPVIDRCASCAGVGRQLNDPTTPDCLVNGATVDLGRALWDFLFEGAPPSVYDIEYGGDVYAGWDTNPAPLASISGAQCGCG